MMINEINGIIYVGLGNRDTTKFYYFKLKGK